MSRNRLYECEHVWGDTVSDKNVGELGTILATHESEASDCRIYAAKQLEEELERIRVEGASYIAVLVTKRESYSKISFVRAVKIGEVRDEDYVLFDHDMKFVSVWTPKSWAETWLETYMEAGPEGPEGVIMIRNHDVRPTQEEFALLIHKTHEHCVTTLVDMKNSFVVDPGEYERNFWPLVDEGLRLGLTLPAQKFYLMNTDPKSMEYVCQTGQGILRYRSRTNPDYGLEVRDLSGMLLSLIGDLNVRPPTLKEMQAELALRTTALPSPAAEEAVSYKCGRQG